MEVVIGGIYRHFKGNVYKVLLIAYDCDSKETLEKLIVYQDLSDQNKIWVRKYDEFISKVDKEKYPNVTQEYRFEMIDND